MNTEKIQAFLKRYRDLCAERDNLKKAVSLMKESGKALVAPSLAAIEDGIGVVKIPAETILLLYEERLAVLKQEITVAEARIPQLNATVEAA